MQTKTLNIITSHPTTPGNNLITLTQRPHTNPTPIFIYYLYHHPPNSWLLFALHALSHFFPVKRSHTHTAIPSHHCRLCYHAIRMSNSVLFVLARAIYCASRRWLSDASNVSRAGARLNASDAKARIPRKSYAAAAAVSIICEVRERLNRGYNWNE